MKHQHILVTGASGFVGSALVQHLQASGRNAIGVHRSTSSDVPRAPNLSATADWSPVLRDIDVIVHAAARVHVMSEKSANPLAAFRAANVDGTLALARQAASAGVGRFIFISSIKVNGEETAPGNAFSAADIPAPIDAYGLSKAEAEAGLWQIARDTGMQVVVVRPPLVYGPGVKANFQSMMRWLQRGVPLPLGSIRNERSLVGLDNLVDLIATCIDHPAAAGQVFLAADGEDMSTPELLRRVAFSLGTEARLFPAPERIMVAAAHLLGKPALAQRLLGSLQVDITAARTLLDWKPPVTVDQGLHRTAAWFLSR